ncbi:MAG: site-2 protease family protein [Patescibacteria group bacterium]
MDFIFIIIILIMSVILHELSHGYAALFLGDNTAKHAGRLTLNPIKHIDPVGSIFIPLMLQILGTGIIFGWAKPVPYNPYNLRNQKWGELIVAAAGPITNLFLAVIFGLVIRFGINFGVSPAFINLGSSIVILNIVLGLFNLIPIPPLDGSKILFSILPLRFQGLKDRLEQFGFVIVLFFVFFLWDFVSPLIGWLYGLLTGLPF